MNWLGHDTVQGRIEAQVQRALDEGMYPMRVVLAMDLYRALAAAQPLQPRHIGQHAATVLRVTAHGFDLVVDCDALATAVHVSARHCEIGWA